MVALSVAYSVEWWAAQKVVARAEKKAEHLVEQMAVMSAELMAAC